MRYNVQDVKRSHFLTLTILFFATTLFAQERVLLDASFDNADLTGWKIAGDLCVAPAFCGGQPEGKYWVAFSTNNDEDSMTMCGSNSVGGMESILRTPYLALAKGDSQIRVDFKIKFLTNETTTTDLGTDLLTVRLLTMAGPVVIAAFDDSGASPGSKNLTIRGDDQFHPSDCSANWKYETGLLQVSYYRSFHDSVLTRMSEGPMALEFSLSNQFDSNFDSAVVIDDVQVRLFH